MKRCLVLGAALCLFDDIEAALDLSPFDGVVAAKGAGRHWAGELDAWVSLHPEMLKADMAIREAKGYPPARENIVHEGCAQAAGWAHAFTREVKYQFPGQTKSGSSGLFAIKVALELGFDRLVLCGIPLVRTAGKIEKGEIWHGAESFQQGFEQAMPHISMFTRSMSGWTKQKLGEPNVAWLTGD